MEIYSSVIKDAMSYSYAFYSLFDLDENGIKELIWGYGDNDADFVNDVYSIDTELLPLYLGRSIVTLYFTKQKMVMECYRYMDMEDMNM